MRDRDQAIETVAGYLAGYGLDIPAHSTRTHGDFAGRARRIIDAYEALPDPVYEVARSLLKAWDDFNDPKIRVGPVHPRMRDLRAALEEK